MFAKKGFDANPRRLRILYLSFLSCVVVLFGLLSYTLQLHFDLRLPRLSVDHAKTQNGAQTAFDLVALHDPEYSIVLTTYVGRPSAQVQYVISHCY